MRKPEFIDKDKLRLLLPSQAEFGITPVDLMYMGTQGENGEDTHCTAVYLCTSFSGTPKADGKEMHGAFFLSPEKLDEQFGDHLFPPFADSLKMPKSAQIMQTLSMDISDGCGIIRHEDFGVKGMKWGHHKFKSPDGTDVHVEHNPDDYSNVRLGQHEGSGRNIGGFEDSAKAKVHINKYAKDMRLSEKEYKKKAVEFLSKPMTDSMEEMETIDKKGYRNIYRYDYATNEFGVINSRDNVSTYYFLDEKAPGWEVLVKNMGR